MLRTKFEPKNAYQVVVYLRMSQKGQNPRSPDQQLQVIEELIRRLRLPWRIVKIYRDNAVSGRFTRKRRDFQRMCRELRSGEVQADLIIVDTFERLTRADDGDAIRRRFQKMGLLVLTADSGFADPTSTAGKALAMVESIRASEDGRVKAHNVLRGKKDSVLNKQWPGGSAPFGFFLQTVFKIDKGKQEIDYRFPEPDPDTRWIVEEMFRLADEKGFGTSRIAKTLNEDPRIPECYKPFHPATVGTNLDNPLYYGEMIWGRNCTGIVDDTRLVDPVPEDEWIRVPDFCQPIVSRERWDRVQQLRLARRSKCNRSKQVQDNDDALAGINAPGLALKYPLTGLVLCAHCRRRMIAQAGAAYVTTAGVERRYVAYTCAGLPGGLCHNRRRVPEAWLREIVMNLMRERLNLNQLDPEHPALIEFLGIVRRELESLDNERPDPSQALLAEKECLEERCLGWRQTLGNPSLSPTVRIDIEAEYERASIRIRSIEAEQAAQIARAGQRERVLDPVAVWERLQRFGAILNGDNASAINLLLSQHIDAIICNEAGHVVVRTCKLGALAGDLELFATSAPKGPIPETGGARFAGTPRRRARLATGDAIENDDEAAEANDFAVVTERFAGLSEEWFTEDHFDVPKVLSWAEANALAVAEYRRDSKSTMEATAKHFGKTVPTIRAALWHAAKNHGIEALGKSISGPNRPNWSRDNARVVADFMTQPGATLKSAVEHFGKSEPTIRKALLFAEESLSDSAEENSPNQSGGHDAAA